MSADNYLVIQQPEKNLFVVYHGFASGGPTKEYYRAESLERAVRWAQRFIESNVVEYGMTIHLRDDPAWEQEVGKLVPSIWDMYSDYA